MGNAVAYYLAPHASAVAPWFALACSVLALVLVGSRV